jgi:thiamine-phosphate pyrophosphorylase
MGYTKDEDAMRIDYSLYLVADTASAFGRDLPALVASAVEGGVTVVQLRSKALPLRDFLELAAWIKGPLDKAGLPLLINDRADVALACGAAGVHLGQDDLPLPEARRILGAERVIGVSVNTLEEALDAERAGADYVGLGPVFPTSTKETRLAVVGPEGVARLKAALTIPVVAIGGITAANAPSLARAGADGIAVVSAILGAADARRAAAALRSAFGR